MENEKLNFWRNYFNLLKSFFMLFNYMVQWLKKKEKKKKIIVEVLFL